MRGHISQGLWVLQVARFSYDYTRRSLLSWGILDQVFLLRVDVRVYICMTDLTQVF